MAEDNSAEALALAARMQQFGKVTSVTRLGGLTNRVYRVEAEAGLFALRLPGAGTGDYINRAHEAEAAWQAARAGVAPALIHFDHASGVMATRFLAGTVTMTPALFKSRPGAPARAGAILRKLHGSAAKFPGRFDLFRMIDGYLKLLAARNAELPDGYHDAVRAAGAVKQALKAHPLPLSPCHCDPLAENFLDSGERMWLIDWEYSGMNDPLWDLGDASVEAGFDAGQDEAMLRAYFGGEPSAAERGRIVIYKAMCDLLWTLWGLIQHADQNPADDFWAYALKRFARCQALAGTADFARHVAAVRKG